MRGLFRLIQRIEEVLLAVSMIGIAVLTIVNVFTRGLFGRSLAWGEELTQFFIIIVTFVGLSYAASKGRHIRMTAIYDQLPHRPRKALAIGIAGLTSLLLFFLAYLSIEYVMFKESYSPVLRVPWFIVYLAAPLGLTLAGIQYALTVVQNLRKPEVYLSFERTDAYEPEEQNDQPVSERV